ncbi:MAG: PIN domain nuclease [Kineosporiaceae bacterium]
MNLIDTSAWVDYLRAAPTRATATVREMLTTEPDQVAICEPIAMELLAGAGDGIRSARLELLVNGLPSLSVEPATDFRAAATIYRAARRAGLTIRSLVDCLIAAQAIRHDVILIHKDVDYEVIAQLTPLRAISLR